MHCIIFFSTLLGEYLCKLNRRSGFLHTLDCRRGLIKCFHEVTRTWFLGRGCREWSFDTGCGPRPFQACWRLGFMKLFGITFYTWFKSLNFLHDFATCQYVYFNLFQHLSFLPRCHSRLRCFGHTLARLWRCRGECSFSGGRLFICYLISPRFRSLLRVVYIRWLFEKCSL